MADIIILVLGQLGQYLQGMGVSESLGIGSFAMAFGFTETGISPEVFQLIIGIYLIEIVLILAMFLTKINHGENKTYQWNTASKMLIIGIVLYVIIALSASSMFGDLIKNALGSLGIMGG
jgi:RsiW-degrading membrane proteinase PrsW (M82 family)